MPREGPCKRTEAATRHAAASEAVPDDDVPDEESPPKKLLRRDHELPDPPWPPLEEPRGEHSAPVCGDDGAAIPGDFGSQLSRGISA